MSGRDPGRTSGDALPRTAEDAAREEHEIDAFFKQVAAWKKELRLDEPVVLSDEYLALVAEWTQRGFNAEGTSKSWVFRHDTEFKRYFQMVRESNRR